LLSSRVAATHAFTRPLHVSGLGHFRAVLNWAEHDESVPYVEALVAMVLAVGLAAHAVMVWRLDHGQWMIWSAVLCTAHAVLTPATISRSTLHARNAASSCVP
jgi:hypothetical protein